MGNIKKDFDLIFLRHFHEPVNFVYCTIHTSYIGTIRCNRPITNWNPQHLNASLRKVTYDIFGDPTIVMSSHDLIAKIRTKGLTKTVGIHGYSSVYARLFIEKSIE